MSKALVLTRKAQSAAQNLTIEIVQGVVVLGCGLALVLAGQPTPL